MQYRPLAVLTIAQIFAQCAVPMVVLLGGIVGAQIAPVTELATLPVALMIVGTAATSIPAALCYTVFEARDGTEAIELLTSTSAIDLLFTDIVLPGSMNGVEIGKRALVLQPGIKVLFTSGYTQHAFDFDQGFDEVVLLDKPYRSAELTQAIRVLLDKKICESTRLAM